MQNTLEVHEVCTDCFKNWH